MDRLYTITCVCGISVKANCQDRGGSGTTASVRQCPGCHPEAWAGRRLPFYWRNRLPGAIPQNTLDAWAAEDQDRLARVQAARPRFPQPKTK